MHIMSILLLIYKGKQLLSKFTTKDRLLAFTRPHPPRPHVALHNSSASMMPLSVYIKERIG
jgi:hypothetical protein